jgi:hypothetical protein
MQFQDETTKTQQMSNQIPIHHGEIKHLDRCKRRFVDDDDDFDPENGYVLYFINDKVDIRIGDSWNMVYFQSWDKEIVCDMGGYGGGTCLLGQGIQDLCQALKTLYNDFNEFDYRRIVVERKLWKQDQTFVREAERRGAEVILVI